jgi:short-subunit dehydrogenase
MERPLALVTGASSGIGLALAHELASRGYDLCICSSGDRLGEAAEQLRSTGADVLAVTADLGTADGVESLWKRVSSTGRELEIACINAGIGVGGLFAETDLEEELKSVNLNCTGTVHLAKYVVQHMAQRNSGRILFTASIAGEMVAPRQAVYAATKAFDLSLAHSIRYELRDTNVSVTALQPGPTDTDFFHRAGMDDTPVGSEGKRRAALRTSLSKVSRRSWTARTTFMQLQRRRRSKECSPVLCPATSRARCTRRWRSQRPLDRNAAIRVVLISEE